MGSGYAGKYQNTYGSKNDLKDDSKADSNKQKIESSSKKTSIDENAKYVKEKYGLDENGKFCESTKRAQVYRSKNPIEDSVDFYEKLGTGGRKDFLPNGHGTRTFLDDGSVITHRIVTSTPNSPAVDINITSPSFVKSQKIHFIYESE